MANSIDKSGERARQLLAGYAEAAKLTKSTHESNKKRVEEYSITAVDNIVVPPLAGRIKKLPIPDALEPKQ